MDTSTVQSTSSPSRSPIVDKSLGIYLQAKTSRSDLKWGTINVVLLSILLFDLSNKCPYAFSKWYYLEYAAAGLLGLSVLYYFSRYFFFWFTFEPINGTQEQRKLLHFDDGDTSFVVKSPARTDAKPQNTSSLNVSTLSWHSSQNDSNRNIISPSWAYNNRSQSGAQHSSYHLNYSWHGMSSHQNSFQGSPSQSNNNSFSSPYKTYAKDEIITDEEGLQKYLREVAKESNAQQLSDVRDSVDKNSINTLWNYCNNSINLLKSSVYQLSPTTASPTKQHFNEDFATFGAGSGCGIDLDGNSELLKSMTPTKLTQCITNLRMYISATILQRLVKEIDSIDNEFNMRGFSDLKIGTVGLERLKKTAEIHQLSAHVTSLPLVIPFLELSANQEYLVQRIRELAKGSSINDYRWNSSYSYDHNEHITDAAIIFHLFCAYIDSQLMPLPQPGGRAFYNRYVVWGDNKKSPKETLDEVKSKAKCAILCTNPHKPKFNFICDDKIHHCNHDRNNLFCVIIHFLIFMKERNSSLLDGVNLGRSGLNILGVIED